MNHTFVDHTQWLTARKELLAKEKEFTRLRDESAGHGATCLGKATGLDGVSVEFAAPLFAPGLVGN